MEWALQSTPARRRRLVSPPLVQGQLTLGPSSSFVGIHHERDRTPIRNFCSCSVFKPSSREAIEQSRTQHAAHNYFFFIFNFIIFLNIMKRSWHPLFCDATLSPTTEASERAPMRERVSIEIFALFLHWAHSSQHVRPSCAGCSRRSFTATAATAAPFAFSAMPSGASPSPPEPVTDRNGAVVTMDSWLKSHATDVPDLVLGLDGEPHFLLTVATGDERNVQPYALRAECTHLGCLVQPDPLTGGFACPCHGSRCEFPCKPVVSLPRIAPSLVVSATGSTRVWQMLLTALLRAGRRPRRSSWHASTCASPTERS